MIRAPDKSCQLRCHHKTFLAARVENAGSLSCSLLIRIKIFHITQTQSGVPLRPLRCLHYKGNGHGANRCALCAPLSDRAFGTTIPTRPPCERAHGAPECGGRMVGRTGIELHGLCGRPWRAEGLHPIDALVSLWPWSLCCVISVSLRKLCPQKEGDALGEQNLLLLTEGETVNCLF